MIELLGRMPKKLVTGGKYSKDLFNRKGELKYIRKLNYWSLEEVFVDKYKWSREEAKQITEFILPMLHYLPEKRATAAQMLQHPWMKGVQPLLPSDLLIADQQKQSSS